MANERLRSAIAEAGLDAQALADLAEVDIKTAYRWLGGRIPYGRHRTRVASALDMREADLWPEAELAHLSSDARSEIIGAFAQAGDPRAPDWRALLQDATQEIDLLDYTLLELVDTPGTIDLVAAKGAAGCRVRILVARDDAESRADRRVPRGDRYVAGRARAARRFRGRRVGIGCGMTRTRFPSAPPFGEGPEGAIDIGEVVAPTGRAALTG